MSTQLVREGVVVAVVEMKVEEGIEAVRMELVVKGTEEQWLVVCDSVFRRRD